MAQNRDKVKRKWNEKLERENILKKWKDKIMSQKQKIEFSDTWMRVSKVKRANK